MNGWLTAMIMAGTLLMDGLAPRKGPQILNVDQQISIDADGITLGRLLQLWDQATGMHSSVPPELANRIVSVHVAGLSESDAARKIFDGLPLDYVLVEGKGIVVTAHSQDISVGEECPADNNPPEVVEQPPPPENRTLVVMPSQQQPEIIPTPFGPLVAPGLFQAPMIQLPPVPGAPPQMPFFKPEVPVVLPWGVPANAPAQNSLFGPLPVYQNVVPQWGR